MALNNISHLLETHYFQISEELRGQIGVGYFYFVRCFQSAEWNPGVIMTSLKVLWFVVEVYQGFISFTFSPPPLGTQDYWIQPHLTYELSGTDNHWRNFHPSEINVLRKSMVYNGIKEYN